MGNPRGAELTVYREQTWLGTHYVAQRSVGSTLWEPLLLLILGLSLLVVVGMLIWMKSGPERLASGLAQSI